MVADPELAEDETLGVGERVCADCGGPVEPGVAAGKSSAVCGPCYEVYVHNAGRW